jgi:hypothetical protein
MAAAELGYAVVDRLCLDRDNTECSPWNIDSHVAAGALSIEPDELVEAKEHGCRRLIRPARGLYANLDAD